MRKIRSKDTKPEMAVRSYLHGHGLRYRLHKKGLPGNPDIVLPKFKTVVFVHGCFWHQHPSQDCPHTGLPLSNRDYWKPKLERTMARDKVNVEQLEALGWHVVVVWECEISEQRLHDLYEQILEQHSNHR